MVAVCAVGSTVQQISRRRLLATLGVFAAWSSESSAMRPAAVAQRASTSLSSTAASAGDNDGGLLIVGCGYLGLRVASRWEGAVVGETRSATSHDAISKAGATPTLRADRPTTTYPNVLFCAPPGANAGEYAAEVTKAAASWDGTGGFVFTSSGAVYAESQGGQVTEESPLSPSDRSQTIIQAEDACRAADGAALRLAGLYSLTRGPHAYWLKQTTVKSRAGGIVNLLHYDDAATASIAALKAHKGAGTWLVSDGSPITRAEICTAALAAPLYADREVPVFEGDDSATSKEPLGRVYDDKTTRAQIKWQPKYSSFAEFMKSDDAREEA